MVVSKEQALKKLDELEEKVDEKLASEKALRLGAEKEVDDLRKVLEDLKGSALEHEKRALKAEAQRDDLQHKLDGYGDLGKALAKIRGEPTGATAENIRAIVQEEVVKLNLTNPGAIQGVQVGESIPYVDLKVSSPWLSLDESTVEGQVAVMALHEKLPETFNFSDVMKGLNKEYSVGPRRQTVQKALDALVGKYKALERKVQGNQWVYTLRSDAKSRVKESEAREAVEANES